MNRSPEILNDIIYQDGVLVNFGDNSKGYVVGIGNIDNSKTPLIYDILLVRNLKHNFLSISQLCDKGFKIKFGKDKCTSKIISQILSLKELGRKTFTFSV